MAAVVSCRPIVLHGIERRVGLLLIALPRKGDHHERTIGAD
jgi:hypothetical protein